MTQFFSEAAPVGWQERDNQKSIAVDYRMCFDAMGAGRENDREYLAEKYGREIKTVKDLNDLGSWLFAQLGDDERASDLYDIERKLNNI